MHVDGTLFIGENRLATGRCSLWPDGKPAAGSMAGGLHHLLHYDELILKLASGETWGIVPRRVEYSADEGTVLVFDLAPDS